MKINVEKTRQQLPRGDFDRTPKLPKKKLLVSEEIEEKLPMLPLVARKDSCDPESTQDPSPNCSQAGKTHKDDRGLESDEL